MSAPVFRSRPGVYHAGISQGAARSGAVGGGGGATPFSPAPTTLWKMSSVAGGVIADEGTSAAWPLSVTSVSTLVDPTVGPMLQRDTSSRVAASAGILLAANTWSWAQLVVHDPEFQNQYTGYFAKDASGNDYVVLSANIGGPKLYFYAGAVAGPSLTPGQTYVMGGTHTSGQTRLYLDGIAWATVSHSTSLPNNSLPLHLGEQGDDFGSGRKLIGKLGRTAIFDGAALTDDDHVEVARRLAGNIAF